MSHQPDLFSQSVHETRDTSIEAYHSHAASGKLSAQQQAILGFLAEHRHPMTRGELASAMRMRLSSVCGRVKELLKMGKLQDHPRRPCSLTGIMSHEVSIKQ